MNDARFWKHELFREVSRFRKAIADEGISPMVARRSPFIERFAFVTAYEMRKLDEAKWLTLDVVGRSWRVAAFPCVVVPPHRRWFTTSNDGKQWRQPLEEHYDLSAPQSRPLGFGQVCDYMIHHFAFDVRPEPASGAAQLLFNSERTKGHWLFGLLLDTYLDLVLDVAADEVRWVDMNASTGRVIQRRDRPRM